MTLAREMYKEHILDQYRNPQNKGELAGATHTHTENNPLCGDEVTVQVIVDDGNISDIKWDGKGCAISMASASLLTEKVKGMSVEDIMQFKKDSMLELIQIPVGPVRLKCVLLCLETLQKAVMDTK